MEDSPQMAFGAAAALSGSPSSVLVEAYDMELPPLSPDGVKKFMNGLTEGL